MRTGVGLFKSIWNDEWKSIVFLLTDFVWQQCAPEGPGRLPLAAAAPILVTFLRWVKCTFHNDRNRLSACQAHISLLTWKTSHFSRAPATLAPTYLPGSIWERIFHSVTTDSQTGLVIEAGRIQNGGNEIGHEWWIIPASVQPAAGWLHRITQPNGWTDGRPTELSYSLGMLFTLFDNWLRVVCVASVPPINGISILSVVLRICFRHLSWRCGNKFCWLTLFFVSLYGFCSW